MPLYVPPIRDTRFVLDQVLNVDRDAGGTSPVGIDGDEAEHILEAAGKFAAGVLFPLNGTGDVEGCRRAADGSVATPSGFRDAYRRFVEGGWTTISAPAAFGGQALPWVIVAAIKEYMNAGNMAFAMYPALTQGAIAALLVSGDADQQGTYLPPMVAGRWTGTMNLTEPHCGTDLGQIRTAAEPMADGSFAVTGTKIFISAGEHDLAENIVHLVLARTPGAPDGTKGLSLFVVPKFLIGPDGTLGPRNAVHCTAIERKMGIRANATCTMRYDGARGWLVGRQNAGLSAMFVMMNAARLGVGLQGLGIADVSLQNAAAHATAPRGYGHGEVDKVLLRHPDVRRMLMEGKALTEGLRALCLWGAAHVDRLAITGDPAERQRVEDMLGILTPVIKGWGTDTGYRVATLAQQVLGGHGYIVGSGMEQYVRDARIAMLYEGANGVQAMDLVRRKLPANDGRAIRALMELIRREIADAADDPATQAFARRLAAALVDLKAATEWMLSRAADRSEDSAAGAYDYMTLVGIVSAGLLWLRMVAAAERLLAAGQGDPSFAVAKRTTGLFYATRILPDTAALRSRIEAGADMVMALPPEAFR